MKHADSAGIADLEQFDELIDVRSPDEYAHDRIPGAHNFPVLDNEQRARVGTLYKQVSPFDARKLGAVLVADRLLLQIDADLIIDQAKAAAVPGVPQIKAGP